MLAGEAAASMSASGLSCHAVASRLARGLKREAELGELGELGERGERGERGKEMGWDAVKLLARYIGTL